MLTSYLSATRRLLQNPSAPTSLYSDADLTADINVARGQLAGEGQCCRFMASLALSTASQVYQYASISLSGSVGLLGVLAVRQVWYVVGTGQQYLRPRPFPWFSLYHLNTAAPRPGPPTVWAQYAEGVAGSLYFGPYPDTSYTAKLDCVCSPVALVDDTTAEAIPGLWTDAVPYFAAYLALLGAQTGARTELAMKYFGIYGEFVARARRASTPDVMSRNYPQNPNPVRGNQLGQQQGGGG